MLKNQNAVITGSTSGIGLGIAKQLAKAGANVALNSFTNTKDDYSLAKKISTEFNVKATFISADMSKPDECVSLISNATEILGLVSILVNNAGIQHVAPIENFPTEKWEKILAINLSSSFHTIRSVVPGMKKLGWGRIINIASAHGLTASPYKSAYVSAKHGLVGLSKVIALELAEHNITSNAICPGYVMTPLIESQIPDQMKTHNMDRETVIREVMLERQPSKQFAMPEQLGDFVVFLCSDAASQITGTALSMDGGWTAL